MSKKLSVVAESAEVKQHEIVLNDVQLQMLMRADAALVAAQRDFNLLLAGVAAAAGMTKDVRVVALNDHTLIVSEI